MIVGHRVMRLGRNIEPVSDKRQGLANSASMAAPTVNWAFLLLDACL